LSGAGDACGVRSSPKGRSSRLTGKGVHTEPLLKVLAVCTTNGRKTLCLLARKERSTVPHVAEPSAGREVCRPQHGIGQAGARRPAAAAPGPAAPAPGGGGAGAAGRSRSAFPSSCFAIPSFCPQDGAGAHPSTQPSRAGLGAAGAPQLGQASRRRRGQRSGWRRGDSFSPKSGRPYVAPCGPDPAAESEQGGCTAHTSSSGDWSTGGAGRRRRSPAAASARGEAAEGREGEVRGRAAMEVEGLRRALGRVPAACGLRPGGERGGTGGGA
jgi:hypothetical protein